VTQRLPHQAQKISPAEESFVPRISRDTKRRPRIILTFRPGGASMNRRFGQFLVFCVHFFFSLDM
jgi:hypothetical protein